MQRDLLVVANAKRATVPPANKDKPDLTTSLEQCLEFQDKFGQQGGVSFSLDEDEEFDETRFHEGIVRARDENHKSNSTTL